MPQCLWNRHKYLPHLSHFNKLSWNSSSNIELLENTNGRIKKYEWIWLLWTIFYAMEQFIISE